MVAAEDRGESGGQLGEGKKHLHFPMSCSVVARFAGLSRKKNFELIPQVHNFYSILVGSILKCALR